MPPKHAGVGGGGGCGRPPLGCPALVSESCLVSHGAHMSAASSGRFQWQRRPVPSEKNWFMLSSSSCPPGARLFPHSEPWKVPWPGPRYPNEVPTSLNSVTAYPANLETWPFPHLGFTHPNRTLMKQRGQRGTRMPSFHLWRWLFNAPLRGHACP